MRTITGHEALPGVVRSHVLRLDRRFVGFVIIVTVGLACAWAFVARRELAGSVINENITRLEQGRLLFDAMRARTQQMLRSECRLLVEDPRLKATLATQGIDEATVADILGDLKAQRGSGMLLVLTPEGRVFAQAGADPFRGLDLSASTVVKNARGAGDAVGAWVIGGSIVDVGITSVRFDRGVIAYLVVGLPIDPSFLKAVGDGAGASVAIISGTDVTIASSEDVKLKNAFAHYVRQSTALHGHAIEIGGERYVAMMTELEPTAQTHPRLALLRAVAPSASLFAMLSWLLVIPPILVLGAVLLATSRSSYRT